MKKRALLTFGLALLSLLPLHGCPTCVGRAENHHAPFFSEDFQELMAEDEAHD